MKAKSSVTQSKIAREVGVSQTTVSFVLSGKEKELSVSEETKELILSKAKELGYFKKKKLNRKKTGNIGYIIPPRINLSDPYYHRFFVGIEETSKKLGKNVIVETWEKSLPPLLWNNKIDGVILEAGVREEEAMQVLNYVPVVLLNYALDNTICDMVMPDNRGGIRQAVSYLYELGHRRIGFFALISPEGLAAPSSIHVRERLEGYYQALGFYRLPINEEHVYLPPAKVGGVKEIENYAHQILKKWKSSANPPTAVITTGDTYGISLIKVAISLGIQVPQELSIVGFDNTIACHYISPTLSSIEQSMEEMGRLSVELLEKRIEDGDSTIFKRITCGTKLIVRESVGKVNPGECRGKRGGAR